MAANTLVFIKAWKSRKFYVQRTMGKFGVLMLSGNPVIFPVKHVKVELDYDSEGHENIIRSHCINVRSPLPHLQGSTKVTLKKK